MDDLNRRMMEARRAQALQDRAKLEAEAEAKAAQREEEDERADKPAPAGAGKLRLERRQGEWRYYLGEHRVRVGQELEFFVSREVGWVRATFQWGRRNTSPPSLRLVVRHPDDDTLFLGEAVISLPDDAVLRWPEPE
jgi:hypothetical protein